MPGAARKRKQRTAAGPAAGTPADPLDVPSGREIVERLLEVRRVAGAAGQKLSLEAMADVAADPAGHLGRVVSGKAKASADFRRKAWQWIQLREMRADDADVGRVAETTVTRRVARLCAYCQVERCMGMLVSETSAGKTTALAAYAQSNPAAVYVHGGNRTNSALRMIDAIWRRAGFRQPASRHGRKGLADKWDDVVRAFSAAGGAGVTARIVLVDDAHSLSFSAIEALRELHDETGVGIVLAGTTRLEERLTLAGDVNQMYEQVRARVMMTLALGRPAAADVEAVARAWAPPKARFTAAALRWLTDLSAGLGALRLVKAHVRTACRLGGRHKVDVAREAIDEAHLAAAHELLHRRRSSLTGGA